MSTFLKLGVAGIVACLLGCGAAVERDEGDSAAPTVAVDQSIVHGSLDRGRHPSVVALLATEGEMGKWCTGIVIAPDVILTARHCVTETKVENIECPPRAPQVGRPLAAALIGVHLGDDARASPPAAFGRSIHAPYTDALCDNDVALVTLDRKLRVPPLRLARSNRSVLGREIVAVGYGQTGSRGPFGTRRFRVGVPVIEESPTELVASESTCSGDSGGPAIDSETGEVLGVLSRGSRNCAGDRSQNVYIRIAPHLDLIDRIVGKSEPPPPPYTPPSDMGDACTDGSTCASGLCAEASANGYCTRSCGPTVGRCPTGYRCTRRSDATEGVCARRT